MASFVEIDASNIVLRGVVLNDKDTQDESGNDVESIGAKYLSDAFGGTWKRTSYNTIGGVHTLGGTPFRKNYAGIGYTLKKETSLVNYSFVNGIKKEEDISHNFGIKHNGHGAGPGGFLNTSLTADFTAPHDYFPAASGVNGVELYFIPSNDESASP